MATTGRVKGRSVSTGGCVSGFPLHTDISVGNDRHLWLCHADPETVCWKTRKEFKSSQGTCLLSRETGSSSRGEEAVALQGQGATEDHDKGTVAPGRRQEFLSGSFPKASWDVCFPGQRLACKCLAIFYNSLLSNCLEEKASCWLFFLVWCLCRRDRHICKLYDEGRVKVPQDFTQRPSPGSSSHGVWDFCFPHFIISPVVAH